MDRKNQRIFLLEIYPFFAGLLEIYQSLLLLGLTEVSFVIVGLIGGNKYYCYLLAW